MLFLARVVYNPSMLELTEAQKQGIAEICRSYGVKLLLLFGSQVAGKTHRESDVDLAFSADRAFDFENESRFNADLQAVVGSSRVDTVNISKTSPLLKKRIFDEHQALYVGDAFLYNSLASYAVKSYLETKEFRDNLAVYLSKKYEPSR